MSGIGQTAGFASIGERVSRVLQAIDIQIGAIEKSVQQAGQGQTAADGSANVTVRHQFERVARTKARNKTTRNVIFAIVALFAIIIIVAIVNNDDTPESSSYAPGSTSTPESSVSPTSEPPPPYASLAPSAPSPGPESSAADRPTRRFMPNEIVEKQPPVGTNHVLSVTQIRYCLYEKQRIIAMKNIVEANSERGVVVDNFNAAVSDYNSRCGSFQYRRGSIDIVKGELSSRQAQLESEAFQRVSSWR